MSIAYCPFEKPFDDAYTEMAVSAILCIIFQILLLWRTLYYEYKNYQKHNKVANTKISIRITFIALQLVGFCFTFIDVFRFVIDPYFQFIQKNAFSCALVAYSPKVVTIIYFFTYCGQVLFRLELSFRGSHLALAQRTLLLLSLSILIPAIFVPIIFFIFVNKPCIWEWQPSDIKVNGNFAFCDVHSEGVANIVIAASIVWIIVINIIFGVIFGAKLNRVLRHNADDRGSFKLKSLIIKNTILTTFGSISTLINWFIWLVLSGYIGIGTCFLYLDMWFNCFIIALMFKYNDKYYKRFCKVCIICCLMDCDKTYDKNNKLEHAKQLKKTNKYLRPRNESQVSIFASRTELSAETASGCPQGSKEVVLSTSDIATTPPPPPPSNIELPITSVASRSAETSIPFTY